MQLFGPRLPYRVIEKSPIVMRDNSVVILMRFCVWNQVYKAKWNGTDVAVKVLHDQSEKQKQEFIREANILRDLRFDNVVSYYGCAFSGNEVGMLCCSFIPKTEVLTYIETHIFK